MTAVVETQQERVTFWCSFEGRPSNQRVNCGGGEKHIDGAGKVYNTPYHEAEFIAGKFSTDDPVKIAALRKIARDGASGITEDHELYLSRTLPPEKQVDRLKMKLDEANRLRAQLEQTNAQNEKLLAKKG